MRVRRMDARPRSPGHGAAAIVDDGRRARGRGGITRAARAERRRWRAAQRDIGGCGAAPRRRSGRVKRRPEAAWFAARTPAAPALSPARARRSPASKRSRRQRMPSSGRRSIRVQGRPCGVRAGCPGHRRADRWRPSGHQLVVAGRGRPTAPRPTTTCCPAPRTSRRSCSCPSVHSDASDTSTDHRRRRSSIRRRGPRRPSGRDSRGATRPTVGYQT